MGLCQKGKYVCVCVCVGESGGGGGMFLFFVVEYQQMIFKIEKIKKEYYKYNIYINGVKYNKQMKR